MDKFTKDKIITEFEMATSCKASESSQINIELLKKETKKNNSYDSYYMDICMELMQMLTQEIKHKKDIKETTLPRLTDDEKYFLKSIY